jgi:hypothetical protein
MPRLPLLTATALSVVAGAALAVSLAGCGQVDGRLSRQGATVTFRHGTPAALIAQVASQCHQIGGVGVRQVRAVNDQLTGISLEAGPAGVFSQRQLAEMYSCLGQFRAVTGVYVRELNP